MRGKLKWGNGKYRNRKIGKWETRKQECGEWEIGKCGKIVKCKGMENRKMKVRKMEYWNMREIREHKIGKWNIRKCGNGKLENGKYGNRGNTKSEYEKNVVKSENENQKNGKIEFKIGKQGNF